MRSVATSRAPWRGTPEPRPAPAGLREGAGLSRSELARRAGVPVSTLRNWEGDRGMPGLPASARLAEALGVPVERFAEGVEDPQDEEPPPTARRAGRAGESPGGSGHDRA